MKYILSRKHCNCHPETCCCDEYAIYDDKGSVFLSSDSFTDLNIVVASLNSRAIVNADIDVNYFKSKLELIIEGLSNYTSGELARQLVRYAMVANEREAIKEVNLRSKHD